MILPSDSSMEYYPANTVACFTTQLPEEIKLEGHWLVAATEIVFPYTFSNISSSCHLKVLEPPKGIEKYHMELGYYKDPTLILESLNALIESTKTRFRLKRNGYIFYQGVGNLANGPVVADIANGLRNILGYSEKTKIAPGVHGDVPFNLHANIPRELFVYSDICEPSIIGDVHAGLLTSVNVNVSKFDYWGHQHNIFSMPRYMPILAANFRSIVIDIRDRFGNPAPFEGGRSSVTLHFKRMN